MSEEAKCEHYLESPLPVPGGPVSWCPLCGKKWGKWELRDDGELTAELVADTRGWRCVVGTNT